MVASCHRRSGNYQMAFDTYKKIHQRFPDNIECLRFLVRICTDRGMKEVHEYVAKLRKAEKAKEVKESQQRQQGSAGESRKPQSSAGPNRGGSANRPGSMGSRGSGSASRPYSGVSNGDDDVVSDQREYSRPVDASYSDPLGDMPSRPKTATAKRRSEDDFDNEEIGDDLLPD
eukprot:Opistho-2@62617